MKRVFLYLILLFLLLGMTWPLISGWIYVFNRFWLLFPIGCALCFLMGANKILGKPLLFITIFALVEILKELFTTSSQADYVSILTDYFMFVFLILLSQSVDFEVDSKQTKLFLLLFILLLIVTTVSSTIIDNIHPNIVREIQGYININQANPYAPLYKYGLTSYAIPHAIPILIPPFVLVVKNRHAQILTRLFFVFLVVVCIQLTYVSGATTPFLLAIMITLLSFIVRKGTIKSNIKIYFAFLIIGLVALNEEVIMSLLSGLDTIVGGEGDIHLRIIEIQDSISYGKAVDGSDLDSRQIRYNNSISAFFNNILLGADKKSIGGHAFLLDVLGEYGLVGFIPFAIFLYTQIKTSLIIVADEYKSYYLLCVLAGLVVLGTKNMNIWPLWLNMLIVAPLLLNFIIPVSKSNPYGSL